VEINEMKDSLQEEFIAAMLSRMDAQTVVMIELLAELSNQDAEYYNDKYTKRYDALAAKFRKKIFAEK
jgi:flavoprotein